MNSRRASIALICTLVVQAAIQAAGETPEHAVHSGLRCPISMTFDESSGRLLVATGRDGALNSIDVDSGEVVVRQQLSATLSDFVPIRGHAAWLAIDSAENRLLLLRPGDPIARVMAELPLPAAAEQVVATAGGERALVASLWPRCITVVGIDTERNLLEAEATLKLPFAPGRLLLFDEDRRALIADAFGGQVAVLNLKALSVESIRSLRAHNIRGLAMNGDGSEVWMTHQQLNGLARADLDDLHWGNFLKNGLRRIPVDALLNADADLNRLGRYGTLGGVSDGAGDPGEIVLSPGGAVAIAISGTGDVMIGDPDGELTRVELDLLPTTLEFDADGNRLFVSHRLDDAVSVLDVNSRKLISTIQLNPNSALSPGDRGERLFHDARLSHDAWMSCHSCHSEGHTVDLTADTLGDGDYGAPKRIPSLLGVAATAPYGWDAATPTLQEQVQQSVRSTLHGQQLSDEQLNDLVAYLESLEPAPPGRPQDLDASRPGRLVFEQHGCARCHMAPDYTSEAAYDVGLRDEMGRTQFNPPSLAGVSQRNRYFHDGRATSLSEVMRLHQDQLADPLSSDELAELLEFLGSL
jgi:hypothetical protein